ncbi:hypothetical protein BCR39DRAFT_505589 [Naematelia encephala]|uniref:Uncharacterized protein n=1 Tax=Naematelia encephala TaxID=71784 RepID=A0A1Y2B5I5_9TREE|nr:hypothetical protein BCR39DRAFT_505589 [Naematelia encephala]
MASSQSSIADDAWFTLEGPNAVQLSDLVSSDQRSETASHSAGNFDPSSSFHAWISVPDDLIPEAPAPAYHSISVRRRRRSPLSTTTLHLCIFCSEEQFGQNAEKIILTVHFQSKYDQWVKAASVLKVLIGQGAYCGMPLWGWAIVGSTVVGSVIAVVSAREICVSHHIDSSTAPNNSTEGNSAQSGTSQSALYLSRIYATRDFLGVANEEVSSMANDRETMDGGSDHESYLD